MLRGIHKFWSRLDLGALLTNEFLCRTNRVGWSTPGKYFIAVLSYYGSTYRLARRCSNSGSLNVKPCKLDLLIRLKLPSPVRASFQSVLNALKCSEFETSTRLCSCFTTIAQKIKRLPLVTVAAHIAMLRRCSDRGV